MRDAPDLAEEEVGLVRSDEDPSYFDKLTIMAILFGFGDFAGFLDALESSDLEPT